MDEVQGRFYSAQERYITALGHFFLNILNLDSFYSTVVKSLDAAKPQTQMECRDGMQQALSSPQGKRIIEKHPFGQDPEFFIQMAMGMANRSVRTARQTVDSAALVFAHTILDGVLSECVHISSLVNPVRWGAFVECRKVEFRELRRKSIEMLEREAVEAYVAQLDREPMTRRLELLNRVSVPLLKGQPIPTAWIKPDVMRAFDRLRQRIVHGQPSLKRRVVVGDEIYFAKTAGISILGLLGDAHGLWDGNSFKPKSARMSLRLLAIARREFPEFLEVMEDAVKRAEKR
jgi:hypothetical protein